MKILVTEKQLRNILREEAMQNQRDIALAQQLMNDPNNEVIWRCFKSTTETSIFQNGYTSEYFGDGEGSMYGNGVYFFRKPQGALWRVGTGGVGDKIMKCVILGGFKDFLIFDKNLAIKYYGTADLTVQFKHFFRDQRLVDDMLQKAKEQCGKPGTNNHTGQRLISNTMGDYTAPIAKLFSNTHDQGFGYMQGFFHEYIKKSKVRGIIYSGGQDVWAGILFNPREIVPIATTFDRGNNRTVDETGDIKGWKLGFSERLLKNIQTHGDTYVIGEKLKTFGIISDYEKGGSTENGCLKVILKNGRPSLFDLSLQDVYIQDQNNPLPQELEKCLVSKVGFDRVLGWTNVNERNLYEVIQSNRHVYLLKLPNNKYYYVSVKKGSMPYPVCSMEHYDKTGNVEDEVKSRIINEEYDPQTDSFYIYHRTDAASKADNILKLGFSREFLGNNGTSYGDGVYAAMTPEESSSHLRGYGQYMVKGKLRNGLLGFIILDNDRLANKIYGTPEVKKQFDMLIPDDLKPYFKQKFGENYERLCNKYILRQYPNDIAKTNIKGIICYGLCQDMIVVSNFKDIIPIEYSVDNGKTWRGKNEANIERVNNSSDADFDLRQLVANGIVMPSTRGSIYSYINGYARVNLANGKVSYFSKNTMSLISTRGFDKVYAPKNEGEIICEVDINNKHYFIGFDEDVKKYYIAQAKMIITKLASVEELENK